MNWAGKRVLLLTVIVGSKPKPVFPSKAPLSFTPAKTGTWSAARSAARWVWLHAEEPSPVFFLLSSPCLVAKVLKAPMFEVVAGLRVGGILTLSPAAGVGCTGGPLNTTSGGFGSMGTRGVTEAGGRTPVTVTR